MGLAVLLRQVVKSYRRGREPVEVLHHLDLDIEEGAFVALMGPSGSGKTTILNLIGGLDRADSGAVTVAGQHLEAMSGGALAKWRARHVGFVFQFYNLDADAVGGGECGASFAAHRPHPRRAPAAMSRRRCRWWELSERASHKLRRNVRRPAAAGRNRARHRHRSGHSSLRRADRRPGPQIGGRHSGPAAQSQPPAGQDHPDGDARSQGRGSSPPAMSRWTRGGWRKGRRPDHALFPPRLGGAAPASGPQPSHFSLHPGGLHPVRYPRRGQRWLLACSGSVAARPALRRLALRHAAALRLCRQDRQGARRHGRRAASIATRPITATRRT